MPDRREPTLDTLLEFIRDTRGFDFTGYKRSSIQRRVAKRMTELGLERYDDYLDHLQVHGDEFAELFNTLLINATNRRGKPVQVRVTLLPLSSGNDAAVAGAILMMEPKEE
jgi:CheR methyltransferase, all-alpha domain